MKKIYYSLGVVVLIAVGVWLFLRLKPSDNVVSNTNEIIASSSTVSFVTITPLHNTVSYQNVGTTNFQVVQELATTTTGSRVKTSADGRAILQSFATHSTLLDYNTEIILADSSETEKKTSIELLSGAVWSRLQKVFDKGEFNEIKTSNAVAVVRGTSYGVWFASNTTTLIVTEGSVGMSKRDKNTGGSVPGSEVLVSAGQKATLKGNGSIIVSPITSADKKEAWYIFNNPSDVSKPTPVQTSTAPTNTTTQATPPSPQVTAPQNPTLTITAILPQSVVSGNTVTIRGTGFARTKSVVVGKTSIQNFSIVSPTSIQFNSTVLPAGTYTVSVVDLDNTVVSSPTDLTVTAAPAVYQPPTSTVLYPQGQ